MLLALPEKLVSKLPPVWDNFSKTVGVELPHKAGEVVMFEVVGQQISGEFRWSPDYKSGKILAPRNNVIGSRIVDKLVSFGEEGGRHGTMRLDSQEPSLTGIERQGHAWGRPKQIHGKRQLITRPEAVSVLGGGLYVVKTQEEEAKAR